MTTNEERLSAGLKALAASETRGPSAGLEAKLLRKVRSRGRRWLWPAAIAITAAAVWLLAIMWPVSRPRGLVRQVPIVEFDQPEPLERPRPQSHNRAPRHSKRSELAVRQPPLMRIPYSEPLDPSDRAELLRVRMPAAQLLAWGFPFSGSDPNRPVIAEVLVGSDGQARAVRLVRQEQ